MVIVSDNKHHDKRTVVPYSFTVFNYVKEVFRENTQNINIWTDMAHLVNLKISLSLATLVITFFSCFFIIIMQHGIIHLQVMTYKSWKGSFGWSWRHHKITNYKGNHVCTVDLTLVHDNIPMSYSPILDGPIKHSIHHRAEFVILSVALTF